LKGKNKVNRPLGLSVSLPSESVFASGLFECIEYSIGANFNLGPVNLFVAADQVPLKWKGGLPVHTMGTHVSTGMNLLFGWTKGKQQQQEERNDEEW
jgi:hypothetical protein